MLIDKRVYPLQILENMLKLRDKRKKLFLTLPNMNINIKTTAITLTPAISDYADKRLEKIAFLLENDPSVQCDVELAKTTGHHNKGDIFKAEIHLVGSGKNIYASVEKDDLYTAIDIVRDEIIFKLTSNKSKRVSMLRRGGAKMKGIIKGLWPWRKNLE